MKELIAVGQIVNSQGIKGEIKLYPLTNELSRFEKDHVYYIGEEKEPVHIEKYRVAKNLVILKFKEYHDINDILKFKQKYLYVDEENCRELSENEFYIHDLVGMKVKNIKNNEIIGSLKEVIPSGGNDIYVVQLENGKEAMIPAVKEFIKQIDTQKKEIQIEIIEGIL